MSWEILRVRDQFFPGGKRTRQLIDVFAAHDRIICEIVYINPHLK